MKIAIVGGGISGLIAAEDLRDRHDVTLLEAQPALGGHTHTVDVTLHGRQYAIDTGFIVFNDRTYPRFCRRLDEWGVASDPTDMSFSVRDDAARLEYNGSTFNGLFAQRRNLFSPRFHRLIRDILRFNREGTALALDPPGDEVTVRRFLEDGRYSRAFADQYLLPMGAAIWSCPTGTFEQFPMRFIAEFYHHHGLLSIRDRPQWRVIRGGSRTYIEALLRRWNGRVRLRLGTPVDGARRGADGVELDLAGGERETFDHVIFACHSDQALRILRDPGDAEREVLSGFPYSRNIAVLHTDVRFLPRRRRAWASWNYLCRSEDASAPATLTYCMNILQHIASDDVFCVTLNCEEAIDPARVLGRFVYEHPIFSVRRRALQTRHAELLGRNRTSYCGAYWGNGFHEDGVASGMAAAAAVHRLAGTGPSEAASPPPPQGSLLTAS